MPFSHDLTRAGEHLKVPSEALQQSVPFELDLLHRNAFVSLVFFTMRGMRLAGGPRILNWLFYPFREQRFLNVRTYVRHEGEPGIHFITEWISDPVCVHLGPLLYRLPYRYGKYDFHNPPDIRDARERPRDRNVFAVRVQTLRTIPPLRARKPRRIFFRALRRFQRVRSKSEIVSCFP